MTNNKMQEMLSFQQRLFIVGKAQEPLRSLKDCLRFHCYK